VRRICILIILNNFLHNPRPANFTGVGPRVIPILSLVKSRYGIGNIKYRKFCKRLLICLRSGVFRKRRRTKTGANQIRQTVTTPYL